LNDQCNTLSSVGNLVHFRAENAPKGATKRCLDGCPVAETCPYYAPFIYVDHNPLWCNVGENAKGISRFATRAQLRSPKLTSRLSKIIPLLKKVSDYRGWPSSVVAEDATPENLMAALKVGPYGRCVYHCDNDVVDHQVVSMQFEKGTSVTLTMHGHSHLEGRYTRIEGSKATLIAEFQLGGSWIEINEHFSDQRTRYDTSTAAESGHGGGDHRLMAGFVKSLQENEDIVPLTTARTSLESHLMAFAAEDARLGKKTFSMSEYRLG
jgi:hypothetical protein